MTIELRTSSVHGRGVFATRQIQRGESLERAPVLVIPAHQLPALDQTMLYDYYFGWNDDAALAMGFGSFYNHAIQPNAGYEYRHEELVIEFTALRDIAAGEEITIHYNGDPGDASPVWFQERK